MSDQLDNQTTSTEALSATLSDEQGTGDTTPTPATLARVKASRDQFRSERDAAQEALATARELISQLQRSEVERLASESLAMPGDLFSLSGNELADYLTEDGNVDPDKVAEDVDAILVERPGLRKSPPAGFDPTQGSGGRVPKGEPTFADLIKRN